MTHVLDTNVLVVANGQHDGDLRCELSAVTLIDEIRVSGARIGIDSAGRILREYGENIDVKRPPQVGARLLIELYRFMICKSVEITEHIERGFEEFP